MLFQNGKPSWMGFGGMKGFLVAIGLKCKKIFPYKRSCEQSFGGVWSPEGLEVESAGITHKTSKCLGDFGPNTWDNPSGAICVAEMVYGDNYTP